MKRCPKCGHNNDDDSDFCVVDGALLGDGDRMVVSLAEPEIRTQWVATAPGAGPAVGNGPAGQWLIYALLGGLAATVLILGAYIMLRSGALPKDPANQANATNGPVSNDIVQSNMPNVGASQSLDAANSTLNARTSVNLAANGTNTDPVANTTLSDTSRGDANRRFDRTYAGMIGDNSVVMSLTRNGTYLGGRVQNGRSAEIYVEGSVDRSGAFLLNERSDIGLVTGVYRGRLNADGTMTGTWSKPNGDKPRNIYLQRR